MKKLPKVINNKILLDLNVNLLSENEMFNIRGGVEKTRPNSRPREQLDWEGETQIASGTQNSEESSLIDYIKFWFKNK